MQVMGRSKQPQSCRLMVQLRLHPLLQVGLAIADVYLDVIRFQKGSGFLILSHVCTEHVSAAVTEAHQAGCMMLLRS